MRILRMRSACISMSLALLMATPLLADVSFLIDFDDDGDPATIRTLLPTGQTTAVARFVMDVGSLPLPTDTIWVGVEEGCCEAPQWFGHWGTNVEHTSLTFDPLYVAQSQADLPTCLRCCPWLLELTLAPGAPVVAGGRYFIGQAMWTADCFVEADCAPPTTFTFGTQGPLGFTCEVVPVESQVWGDLKAVWR